MTARPRRPWPKLPGRHRSPRPIKRTILIVGEGQETEPNYFRGLKQEPSVKMNAAVTVKPGPGWNPLAVVERACDLLRTQKTDFDEVWCVLDVEGPDKRESLEAARKLADERGIKLCLSNPSFEVWLLSHYQRKARAYLGADDVIASLDKVWQEEHRKPYAKNDARIFERCAGRLDKAVDNARWVRETAHVDKTDTADANSSTEVYRLVTRLRGG